MAGVWTEDAASFSPRFRPAPGSTLVVVGREEPLAEWQELARVEIPAPVVERTAVVAIEPNVDEIPANLLRFSLTFSVPMSDGSAAGHIHLLDRDGTELPGTVLETPELWDRDRLRLTVLLEPGRIKRGLEPNVQAGPPLREGETVTLLIDDELAEARRTYRVGPPIRSRIDPHGWDVTLPTKDFEPLVVRFDRPLDRILVRRYLLVTGDDGRAVAGSVAIADDVTEWTFTPAVPGTNWRLVVDARLEDLAGNSVRRVFDRDLDSAADDGIDEPRVVLTP